MARSRSVGIHAGAVLLAGALCACTQVPENRLRVGTDVDAGSLDPRLMRDTTSYRVCDLLYDGLVRLDRDLNPQPALARLWENETPTRWLFHLRTDVRFHDGAPLTAEDVVHTFRTLLDPDFGAPLRALYAPIVRVEARGPHEVSLELSQPYAPLLRYLDVGIVPANGATSVGTGPYRLKEWARGSRIALEASPDFWGEPPNIDTIEFLVVPDNTARAQAFEAGDLDVVQSPLAPRDIERLARDPRFRVHTARGLAFTYLNFNTSRPPFDDVNVRRAVAMLIDQDTILREIYEGIDEKASSVLFDEPEIRQPGFDPDAAVALLERSGWSATGERLAFELGTHSEDINRLQTVEYLQNVFAGYGIDATLRLSDWASFSVRRDAGDYDVILLGWTQIVDPDRVTYDQFHSGGGLNWGGYRNARVDALLEEGRSTLDPAQRRLIYRSIAQILAEDIPYYVLCYQTQHVFHRASLSGFEPDRRGLLRSLASARR